ncbi:DNA cytosine methyltransferase [Corallococcus exercitus]|uniref:DNA cytosine methyltransferase n=1 Tax=Corallococcus exercitus TaxID=2316736 RepID=UPI0035D4F752
MKPRSVISLFTGAGGLDYGLEAAGFTTRVAVELDADCCETLKQNRPEWRVLDTSIFELTPEDVLKVGRLKAEEVDLLVGGPPCQPFSKAGFWVNGDAPRLADARADTLNAFMDMVEGTLPRVVLLENVQGLAYRGRDEGLQLVLNRLDKLNRQAGTKYKAVYRTLDAAAYGVPQHRTRFILVAARDGSEFQFPNETHAAPEEAEGLKLKPYTTAYDALGDAEPANAEELAPKGKWAGLLPSIPEGFNYLWHTERGGKGALPLFGWRTRYWTFLLKLAKGRPSWTIPAQPGPAAGPFHWKSRRLSVEEMCRLQTFPRGITIVGGRTSAQRQVGNAVPSLLAEVLGRAIREQLLGDDPVQGRLKLLPRRRTPVPPPEPVQEVPEPFRAGAGRHAAHPGTGKGPRALLRESAPALVAGRAPQEGSDRNVKSRGTRPSLARAS